MDLSFLQMCNEMSLLNLHQNAVKTFIFNRQHSLYNSRPGQRQTKGEKKTKTLEKNKNMTPNHEMPIFMGLSHAVEFLTLQITDMEDLHGIKITEDLLNHYK